MIRFSNNMSKDMLERIKVAFLHDDGPIIADMRIEGQRINNQGRYIIGPIAGPEVHASNLLHEAGHFAEREVEKLVLFPSYAWGFSFGKYWEVAGQSGHEPSTDQAVKREQRVWAYQMSLQRQFGIEIDPYEIVDSVIYMAAWCYYQPLPRRTQKDRPRIERLAKDAHRMSLNEFSYDKFLEEWNLRVDRLRNLVNRNGVVSIGE